MALATEVMTMSDDNERAARAAELVAARGVPPFPWYNFRRALILSESGHATNTRISPTAMIQHRRHAGILWPVLETAEHGPLLTAVARAFNENQRRHNLTPTHWRVLLACEVGMVYRTVIGPVVSVDKETGKIYRQVSERLCIYRTDRPDAVLPYEEAPRVIDVRADLAQRYHGEARRACEDEWRWINAGFER